MRTGGLHTWPTTVAEAKQLQPALAARVVLGENGGEGADGGVPAELPRLVAGVDVSYGRFDKRAYAAVVVWDRVAGTVFETRTASAATAFPYVPGYLSFREGPVALEAVAALRVQPGAYLFDGQGIAHPRRFGLASHLGLWLGVPSVGCAKSRLIGEHEEPGEERGAAVALVAPRKGLGAAPPRAPLERLGTVLRTKRRTRPLYVSPGHLCSHEFAVALVLGCDNGYRLPEPTRLADAETKRLRREHQA